MAALRSLLILLGLAFGSRIAWAEDQKHPVELVVQLGHTDTVRAVAFAPNSRWVATGAVDRNVILWDRETGKLLKRFRSHTGQVTSLAFSPDGRVLASASDDKTVRVWEVSTGKEVQVLKHKHWVLSVAFAPDSQHLLSGCYDGQARYWHWPTAKVVRALTGKPTTSVAISADGSKFLTGEDGKELQGVVKLWEAKDGKELRAFGTFGDNINGRKFDFAPNGKLLLIVNGGSVEIWDLEMLRPQRIINIPSAVTAVFSKDARHIFVAGATGMVQSYEVKTGKAIQFIGHRENAYVSAIALSQDGKYLLTGGDDDRSARLWDADTGKALHNLAFVTKDIVSAGFSKNGRRILASSFDDNEHAVWDLESGRFQRWLAGASAELKDYEMTEIRTDKGSELKSSSDLKHHVVRVDKTTGKELCTYIGHLDLVTSFTFSPDGSKVLTGSQDTTVRLWDAATGKELCKLVTFPDSSWAVIDSEGRFDASNAGNVEGLHWVAGMEPIALRQLKERYYDPGLLAKYMGFNKTPLRSVQAFKDVRLYPSADAKPPEKDSSKLTLHLTNQGGGLGKVQVFVNGRELLADARGPQVDPNAAKATLTLDLADAVVIPGHPNQVRVVAWNSEGYLSSRGLDFDWIPAGRKESQPTEMHAIVVGVSSYSNDSLNLRFSGKDAEDMAKALATCGKRLLGADKVHVTLLCDTDPKALPPTRENLQKAFEAARKSRPSDILVVYLAGHGIGMQEQGQDIYCYLTKDARTAESASFRDPAVREQSSLSSIELTEWLKKIPALRQVLILDTCAAGAAASKLMEHREVSADQIRAIDRMRDRTGFHVLMGCAADRVSYEASRYSQGLLTYALLQGIRGAALHEGEFVDVSKLFRYAEDEVPQLAQHIGGIQKPLVLAPRGTSFYVGRLQGEDKKLIPLALVRPLLLRPILLNADENVLDDDLGLMPLLRKKLAEENYAANRGGKSFGAVYVDADEMPGAIRPSGRYAVTGNTVRVTVALRRDGQEVARLQVEGARDDLPSLVARLAAAIALKSTTP